MANPALILAGIGFAFNLFGASRRARAARRQGELDAQTFEFNAEIARLNAGILRRQAALGYSIGMANASILSAAASFTRKIGKYNAQFAVNRAALEAARQRRLKGKILGSQRVMYAAAGVQIDAGTPVLVQEESQAEAELDAQILEYQGDTEAFDILARAEFSATDFSNRASVTRFAALGSFQLESSRAYSEDLRSKFLLRSAANAREVGRSNASSLLLKGITDAAFGFGGFLAKGGHITPGSGTSSSGFGGTLLVPGG